jgi:MYXO-CTERM domain-containing protein
MKIRNIAAALLIALGGAGAANAAADFELQGNSDAVTGEFSLDVFLGAGNWTLTATAEADEPVTSFSLSLGASPIAADVGSLTTNVYSMSATFTGLAAGTYTLKGVTAPDTWFGISANASSQSLTPVPEPESYALALAGLGVVGLLARRRAA